MEKLPFIFHNSLSPSRGSTVLNWHKNIEIIYCTAGCGIAQIDSLKFNFKKNDIIIVNPNEIHSFSSVGSVTYQCLIIDNDFCIENSADGVNFKQMRICHMFNADDVVRFGIYACSAENSSFKATFTNMEITECKWSAHDGQQPDED